MNSRILLAFYNVFVYNISEKRNLLGGSAQQDSTSFPSGGHKIYHERSAIGDMLSAIHYEDRMGLILSNQAFIHIQKDNVVNNRPN